MQAMIVPLGLILGAGILQTLAQEGAPCDDVALCDEGYSCHPSQGICYEDPSPTDKPHIWLGDPNGRDGCRFAPYHCAMFDMDYDISHINGNGDWCETGLKVRCTYKAVPPLPQPTPANEILVAAYNVFERGWFISTDGQRERSCRIPRVLQDSWPDIDVIAFQEIFREGCWPDQLTMKDILCEHGYCHQTATLTSDRLIKVENGGIFLASRWPILEEDSTVFDEADPDSFDQFAAKGVSYAKINKTVGGDSRLYHVMSTHFQAGGPSSVKISQATQWADFVANKSIPANEAVIYAGDFNMNYLDSNFNASMAIMGTSMPDDLIGNYSLTADPSINQLMQERGQSGSGSWIDHVVYSHNHLNPASSHNEIIVPRDPISFPACWCHECIMQQLAYRWPEDWDCSETERRRIVYFNDLSDHFPCLGHFVF